MERNISFERALELIETCISQLHSENVPTLEAHGRVLAEDVLSPIDQPPWPRSPLDGYAVRSEDIVGASDEDPVRLKVTEIIYAGSVPRLTVASGQAARIMTGAPIPDGADCIVMQEHTDMGELEVAVKEGLRPWQNYCFAGEDFRRGNVIIPKGTRLAGTAWGVLAAAGLIRKDLWLSVIKKPRCALICTGDELVSCDVTPLPAGKIYSSNEAVISSRLKELGVEISLVKGVFGDDIQALYAFLKDAVKESDFILTTGGVSVGDKDILPETLEALGVEGIFHGVRMKPGSPLMLSILDSVPILSLSGNPFAAAATFELFGRSVLAQLEGGRDLLPIKVNAVLDSGFNKKGGRRFVRAVFEDGRVFLPEGHSSGQLRSSVGTNCLAEIPQSDKPLAAGSPVTAWII